MNFGTLGTGFGALGRGGAGVGYTFVNAEAAAVSAAMLAAGSEPSNARKASIDTFWTSIKAADLDDDLEILYFMAAHSNAAGLIEWMDPDGSFTASDVNAVTFEADRGAAGNGSSSYRRTQYTPNTHKVKVSLNDFGLGFYSRTDVASSNVPVGCRTTSTTGQLFMSPRGVADNGTYRVNQDVSGTSASPLTTSIGHFFFQRTASNAREVFRDNVSLATGSDASTSLPTTELVMFGLNTGGTVGSFDTRQLSCMYVTKSLNLTKRTALHNAIAAYGTDLGFFLT